jgi:hypothetical protein
MNNSTQLSIFTSVHLLVFEWIYVSLRDGYGTQEIDDIYAYLANEL